ncbi:hypothetical protein ACFL2O_06630 [Thermodesulfobacteriota bacterium]
MNIVVGAYAGRQDPVHYQQDHTINTIEKVKEKAPAHNFQAADTKAYIVKGGENFYLVHSGL